MPTRPRYFYSRDSKSGEYRVKDRQLHDMVVAKCFFREAAALVQTALNQSLILTHTKETQVEHSSTSGPSHGRPAVLGDFIDHGSPELSYCQSFPPIGSWWTRAKFRFDVDYAANRVIPPPRS